MMGRRRIFCDTSSWLRTGSVMKSQLTQTVRIQKYIMPRVFLLPILTAILFTLPALAESAPDGPDLEVVVEGASTSRGNVRLALFSEGDSAQFPGKSTPLRQGIAATGQAVTFRFSDLATGRYAAVAFHDENGNGILDRNYFGIPSEPWGVSGRRPFAGKPRFVDSAFVLDGEHKRISIHLE